MPGCAPSRQDICQVKPLLIACGRPEKSHNFNQAPYSSLYRPLDLQIIEKGWFTMMMDLPIFSCASTSFCLTHLRLLYQKHTILELLYLLGKFNKHIDALYL